MTIPKHTPSPWWIDDDGFLAAGGGDTYVTLADFDCTPDLGIDEREANKALAAAAPELLQALEELIRVTDYVPCVTRYLGTGDGKRLFQARNQAARAIAKAKEGTER